MRRELAFPDTRAAPDPQQDRDQRQVLQRFVERDRVAEAVDAGELHGPRQVGHGAHDLAVDEVADPSDGQEEGGRDRHLVGDL